MNPTRRELLRLGLGSLPLLACGATVPTFLANAANTLAAEPVKDAKGRILVVLQLDGGNDGLNTIVPYADDDYRKHRPKLSLDAKMVAKIDDRVGFHPALNGFAKLLENRQLAVVQSVGYPNPNRSHFESMAIWQCAARLDAKRDSHLELAGRVRSTPGPTVPGTDVPGLHISSEQLTPQKRARRQLSVTSLRWRAWSSSAAVSGIPEARRRQGTAGRTFGRCAERRGCRMRRISLLQFVERSSVLTYSSSARLERVAAVGATGYPESYGLAQRLRIIGQIIKAGLSTSIYYTRLGGFDTHANQAGTHDNLLREVSSLAPGVPQGFERLREQSARVVVLIFSEFGRRLRENASAGTDHGTAAPVFLLGGAVKSGLHGPYPNLRDLDDGDPKFAIDFRRIYATLLDRWLSCSSEKILGEKFEPLPVL